MVTKIDAHKIGLDCAIEAQAAAGVMGYSHFRPAQQTRNITVHLNCHGHLIHTSPDLTKFL